VTLRNVFQLWKERAEVLPFRVRRSSWAEDSYFIVQRVEIKEDYYKKTGKLYGKAYGQFYHHGKLCRSGYHGAETLCKASQEPIELNNAGSYQWQEVT